MSAGLHVEDSHSLLTDSFYRGAEVPAGVWVSVGSLRGSPAPSLATRVNGRRRATHED